MTGEIATAGEVLALLRSIEQRSQQHAVGLPQLQAGRAQWHGLGFTVAGVRVATAMSEVVEMFTVPELITRVPGVRDWMLGLANVRGNLLPLVDLQGFLGGKPVVPGKKSRVLVIRSRGVTTGLLVSQVSGMRHFDAELLRDNARLEGAVGAYVYQAFMAGDEVWPVFSMNALTADPAFRVAAV